MKFKIIKIFLSIITSIGGGIFLTYVSAARFPFDGPQLGLITTFHCGYPSGFPLSFTETWKYLPDHIKEVPFCLLEFDHIAFILDIAFWSITLFLILLYLNKYLKRKNNQNV